MDYSDRWQRAISFLQPGEGLWIEHPTDLFYLTGLELSAGKLLLQPQKAPDLLIDGRYEEAAKQLPGIHAHLWNGISPCPIDLPLVVFFDSLTLSFHGYESLLKLGRTCQPIEGPIIQVRQVKEKNEIQQLQEAALLCFLGYQFVVSILKEGISERQCARELEIFWLSQGGDGLSFSPIIAFGEHSSKPHHRAGARCLQKGDCVLIDIGVSKHHYHSDMTQVLFYGNATPQMKEIYSIVYKAQQAALSLCHSGMLIATIEEAARTIIEQAGYSFIHGLGHGVGLEIHEWPRLKKGGILPTRYLDRVW